MRERILVAGATGGLGREVVRELRARGHVVRALVRTPTRAEGLGADEVHCADALDVQALRGACEGVQRVFSCLGASVSPSAPGRRSFLAVDVPANTHLLAEARRAGVARFVYVSVFHARERLDIAFNRAHEEVVDRLRASGLDWGVVRPTGFFSALAEAVDMAERGALPELGDGLARSNPIHEADLARVCADVLAQHGPTEVDAGGPEVLTRRQMAELAFAALGRPVRLRRVPAGAARAAGWLLRPFHPRLAQMAAFVNAIHHQDLIAPVRGQRTLGDYFRERVEARRAAA
jgi:uncharacterized protein YbjT (DUF2867 family)